MLLKAKEYIMLYEYVTGIQDWFHIKNEQRYYAVTAASKQTYHVNNNAIHYMKHAKITIAKRSAMVYGMRSSSLLLLMYTVLYLCLFLNFPNYFLIKHFLVMITLTNDWIGPRLKTLYIYNDFMKSGQWKWWDFRNQCCLKKGAVTVTLYNNETTKS